MQVIFETLDKRGQSQRWLAEQLGIHESLLTHYKSGRRVAPESLVRRAADVLGLPESAVIQRADMFPDGDADAA